MRLKLDDQDFQTLDAELDNIASIARQIPDPAPADAADSLRRRLTESRPTGAAEFGEPDLALLLEVLSSSARSYSEIGYADDEAAVLSTLERLKAARESPPRGT